MGLPGQRRSRSHKRRRAAHFAIKAQTLSTCPKCGKAKQPHAACKNCGTYRGRTVVKTASQKRAVRLTRRAKKSAGAKAA